METRMDLAIRNAIQAVYNADNAYPGEREECLEDALIALRELIGELAKG